MQDLPPEARRRLEDIARRHGVSPEAALALLRAISVGKGAMAQFNHPELGGMGQWLRSGMVMVGDMFDAGLKGRVGALCAELSALLGEAGPPFAEAGPGGTPPRPAGAWWPAELGAPTVSGAQNGVRYAYFPSSRRLAVQRGGRVSLHDTGAHRIFGVSQRQGADGWLVFSSDKGAVRLEDLPSVDAAGDEPSPQPPPSAPAPAQGAPAGDPVALIERLAELHAKGVLTTEEFAAKKAELLSRL